MNANEGGQLLRERVDLFEAELFTSASLAKFISDLKALACLMDPPEPQSIGVRRPIASILRGVNGGQA